jgi:hypothetical protein
MNLIILLPILLTLAFAVVLSNQLLQATGIKNSIKFWTNIKSNFLIWYGHNQLIHKYITKPIAGLLAKSASSSGSDSRNGLPSGASNGSPNNAKSNVLDVAHRASNKNSSNIGNSLSSSLHPVAAYN